MASRVLLVVNCALDYSYANRHVLRKLYQDRFDGMLFAVSGTCELDPAFEHVVQSWTPPPLESLCWCGDVPKFTHTALLHCFHPRLVDVAWRCHDYDYVVFTEDDCLLSQRFDADSARDLCASYEVVSPPLHYCPRINPKWVWTDHPAAYPTYELCRSALNGNRLRRNWNLYSGETIPAIDACPMFSGFCDWLIFRRSFLQQLAGDLMTFTKMWHEAAIPTAILHQTHNIGPTNGLALWGIDRQQSLPRLMELLATHDFVHPIKLLRYPPHEIVDEYYKAVA